MHGGLCRISPSRSRGNGQSSEHGRQHLESHVHTLLRAFGTSHSYSQHGGCHRTAISKKRCSHRHFQSAVGSAMKRQCHMSPGKNFTV